jgi:pSer/pThr/pTyr-binding forkhead associated (FHA) protein
VASQIAAGIGHGPGLGDGVDGTEASGPLDVPLVLEVNGVRHPLTPPGFTIGRGSEADLRINEPGVSRLHARVDVVDDGQGHTSISLLDLGSTNGVIVDGHKVTQAVLGEGSRIEMGTTRMLVHSPVGE